MTSFSSCLAAAFGLERMPDQACFGRARLYKVGCWTGAFRGRAMTAALGARSCTVKAGRLAFAFARQRLWTTSSLHQHRRVPGGRRTQQLKVSVRITAGMLSLSRYQATGSLCTGTAGACTEL